MSFNRYRMFGAVLALVLLGFSPASAAEIYVSSTNGDDAFDGTTSSVLGGGVGPKQTVEAALAVAAAGDVLVIEGGTYTAAGGMLTLDKAVTIQVVALSSETRATLVGDLTVAADVELSAGANAFALQAGSNLILESGSLTVITPNDFELPSGVIITREQGTIQGNTPAFGDDTFLVYNDDRAGVATTAGVEIPASMGAGTITIDQESGTLEFPNPVSTSGITVAPSTSVDVTFYSSVTASGDALRSDDAFGNLTFTDLELGAFNLVNAEATGTLSVLGTLSFIASTNDEVAQPAINNSAGGTMALGDVIFGGVGAPNPGTDHMRLLVNGVGGVVTVRESISSEAAASTSEASSQVHDVDVAIFQNRGSVVIRGDAVIEHVYNTHAAASVEFYGSTTINQATAPGLSPNSINNVLGSVTFYAASRMDGDVINAAGQTITFDGDAEIAGDVINAGTISVGPSLTLTLSSNDLFTSIGTIAGANGAVSISGNGAINGADVAGSLSVTGNGDILSDLSVGGDLSVAGDGDLQAVVTVGGDLALSGENDFAPGSATSSVQGTLTVAGATSVTVGAAGNASVSVGGVVIASTGSLTVAGANALNVSGSFDDSAGGAFDASATGAALVFQLADDASWTPGVNRQIDLLSVTGGGGHTLSMNQSVDVVTRFVVAGETILDVTDKLVRLSADDGVAEVVGSVLASQITGALTFKADDQVLTGGGTVTNLTINNSADDPDPVNLESGITVTNKIQLFDSSLDLNGQVLTLGAPPASIERNLSGTETEIVDTAGGGSISGTYHLLYSGAITTDFSVGHEFTDGGIVDLTVEATGGAVNVSDPGSWSSGSQVLISGGVTVLPDAHLNLGSGRDIVVQGAVDLAETGRIDGSDPIDLAGDGVTHTVGGSLAITSPLTVTGDGVSVEGVASDGTAAHLGVAELPRVIIEGAGTEISNIHAIRGDLSVTSGASLTLALQAPQGADTDNGGINGNLVAGGTAFALGSDVVMASGSAGGGGGVLHTAGIFGFGGFDLVMTTASATFANAPASGLGYTSDGGALRIEAPSALNLNDVALPRLVVNQPATLVSGITISEDLDANADLLGPFTTTLLGSASLAAGLVVEGTLQTNGADLTLEGDAATGNLTIAGNTTLAADAGADLAVTGTLSHQAGHFDFGPTNVILDGTAAGASPAYVYASGTYAGTGALVFDDDNDGSFIPVTTAGQDAQIPNVTVRIDGGEAADLNDGVQIVSGDGLTVTETLTLQGGAIDFSTAFSPALTLGDRATIVRYLGVLVDTPTFGALVNNTYQRAVVTGAELALNGGTLIVNANTVLGAGANPTVQAVDLNAQLDATVQDGASLNLASGGTVLVGLQNPLTEPYTSDGPITLIFDGPINAPGTTLNEWPANVPVAHLIVGADVDLGNDHAAQHVTVGAQGGFDLDLAGDHVLTVTGDVRFLPNSRLSNTKGAPNSVGVLELKGLKPQLFTVPAGGFSPSTTASPTGVLISIDNADGVELVGGDLTMDAATEQMRFVRGAFDTASNGLRLTLYHTDSDNQGFVQVIGGVWGEVTKEVVNGNLPGIPPIANQLDYPLCTADCGALRNLSLTFNDPDQVGVVGRTGVTATVRHRTTSPGGDAGVPFATTDANGNPLTITRYPDFHWEVTTNVQVLLASYDVALQADGYDDFAVENIDRAVAIRRESGPSNSSNPWQLVGTSYLNTQTGPTEPTVAALGAVGSFEFAPGLLFTFGLESTITITDPSPVHLQSGQTAQFDLDGGVFSGGNPGDVFTYSVSTNDAGVATASESGGTLTITGVGKGSTTIQVTATDALANARTLEIRVNVDFVVGAIDPVVQHVGGSATVDLSTVVQGGTAPYTYTVTTDNAAVATGAVDGDILTVTGVGAGSTTISVVVTDADGDTVVVTVQTTVTAALFVADPIEDFTLRVGEDAITFDLATVFSASSPTLSFTGASADDTRLLLALDQNELSIAALLADRVGTPVRVDVAAADGLGNEAELTFNVVPLPRWGDGSVDDEVTALDARLVLQHAVGQIRSQPGPLTAVQQDALNVTGDELTAFDSARILQFATGIIPCFNVQAGCEASLEAVGSGVLGWAEAIPDPGTNTVSVPVTLSGTVRDVFAVQFTSQLDLTQVVFLSANTDLPFGWVVEQALTTDGLLSVAIAGPTPLTEPGAYVTLKFQLLNSGATPTFTAEGFLNEGPTTSFGSVTVTANEQLDLPGEFALQGNYPNPFNPTTSVRFDLPAAAEVGLEVFDLLGRRVLALPATTVEAGFGATIQLDASDLASGSYLYRLVVRSNTGAHVATGRMVLLK